MIDFMTRKMKEYTVSLQFEKAQEMKEAIEALKTHQTKSKSKNKTTNKSKQKGRIKFYR